MAASRPKAAPPGRLAITRSALSDLGLKSLSYIGRDPVDLVREHRVVADFVLQRSQSYEGQEATLGVKPTTWNLHAGTWRAVTWYDARSDTCWLVAANQSHDYRAFVNRANNGNLLPTAADFADLDLRDSLTDDFAEAALGQAVTVLDQARDSPGVEISCVLAGEIEMSVYVDDSDPQYRALWLLYRVPPRGRLELEADIPTVLAALFFDDDANVDWYRSDHPARPAGLAQNERVMRWKTSGTLRPPSPDPLA